MYVQVYWKINSSHAEPSCPGLTWRISLRSQNISTHDIGMILSYMGKDFNSLCPLIVGNGVNCKNMLMLLLKIWLVNG